MLVSRRTVLKTMAAALMAPVVQLRPSVPDERLLLPFCETDPWRYSLESPFGVGSLTYATDRRAMIRCELANRYEVGERCLPRVEDVWKAWFRPASQQWSPLTIDDIQPTIEDDLCECFVCGNRRISLGSGYPELDEDGLPVDNRLYVLGWDVDDNTIRDESCPTCRGLNIGHKTVAVVCGQQHKSLFLKRIAALPNVRVCPSVGVEDTRGRHAPGLLFRADGFEGISLGISPD